MTKVVSIQYPSGGFGHFIHVILSAYCKKFNGQIIDYEFGIGGDSHSYPESLPTYFGTTEFDVVQYQQLKQQLDQDKNEFATILIDSGINNDSDEFRTVIHPDMSIRVVYDDWSWPLLSKLFYTRCMAAVTHSEQTIGEWIMPDDNKWDDPTQNWAVREKFFLYLRDHAYRYSWRSNHSTLNIPIDHVLNYQSLSKLLGQQFEINNFEPFYSSWYQTNLKHFEFFLKAQYVWKNLCNNIDINDIDDLFTQAVIYYYIWVEFGFEVPHNTYAAWFTNTKEIVTMLQHHGVKFDKP